MPGQEITVGLRFTADTQAARQQLNTLKQDLINLSSFNTPTLGQEITKGLSDASIAAAKLKTQLEAATSVKTGNLDLTKFSKSLRQSGTDLKYYKEQLVSMGPEGQKAFIQLAQSIQNAEVPLIRISKLFQNLGDTLARTIKWQISSSAIHSFMGAIQQAYGYAQNLNESLNNIRIVTGQSIDQMSKFAVQANKAAKALSATTIAYTDAALIYYQQGLSDEEVLKRTDVTIKMANVTRQSSEEVSNQMTAIWNNFAKGEENLESFADKMVALGAATASSSDEIAQGLEKFAGVADTIGLSFDYAAAALTTITATTRMSADTVGTALKTLFSRLESLKLGDTLEDGTDLTKYSEALLKVGVNVKDANGELKEMDQILDETMAKWKTLSKDQQVALAQTVAGQRQYTQFVTLMDNADFFKENLSTERNASGTLQKQADIYAESWEAASKRVKAATETLYSNLLNDEFFIDLTNGLADILSFIDKLIKSMGGLPGLLSTISALVFNIASEQITARVRDMAFNLKNLMSVGKMATNLKNEATNQVESLEKNATPELKDQIDSYKRINSLQQDITKNAKKISQERLDELKTDMQIVEMREKENLEIQKMARVEKANFEIAKDNLQAASSSFKLNNVRDLSKEEANKLNNMQNRQQDAMGAWVEGTEETQDLVDEQNRLEGIKKSYEEAVAAQEKFDSSLNGQLSNYEATYQAHAELKTGMQELIGTYGGSIETLFQNNQGREDAIRLLGLEGKNIATAKQLQDEYNKKIQESNRTVNLAKERLENLIKTEVTDEEKKKELLALLSDFVSGTNKSIDANIRAMNSNKNMVSSIMAVKRAIENAKKNVVDYASATVSAAKSISNLFMGINSLKGAFDALKNQDMSTWDKISSIMMSISMGLPALIRGMKDLGDAFSKIQQAGGFKNLFSNIGNSLKSFTQSISESDSAIGKYVSKMGILSNTKRINSLLDKKGEKGLEELIKKRIIEQGLIDKETGLLSKEGLSKLKNLGATEAMTSAEAAHAIAQNTASGTISAGTTANTLFAGSMTTVLASILPVIAVLAALAAIIYVVVKAYNKENDALKQANENMQTANEMAERTKNEYEDLKQKIEDLNSAQDTLENLKKGTIEWKEAVADLNSKVLELVQLYPELAPYMKINADGVYELSQAGQDKLSDIQNQKLEAMQNSAVNQLSAQVALSKAQSNKISVDAARKSNSFDAAMIAGYAASVLIPGIMPIAATIMATNAATTKSLDNGLRNVAEQMADSSLTDDDIEALLSGGQLASGQNLEDYLKTLDLNTSELDNLTQALQSNSGEIEAALKSMVSAQKTADSLTLAIGNEIAQQKLQEKKSDIEKELGQKGLSSSYADQYISILAKGQEQQAGALFDAEMAKYYEKENSGVRLTNNELSEYLGVKVKDDQDLMRKYAVAAGLLTEAEAASASYKSGVGKGTLSATGKDAVEANDDYMRMYLWQAHAREEAGKNFDINSAETQARVEELINITNRANEMGAKFGTDFTTAVFNSLSTGKMNLTEALLDIDPNEIKELSKQSTETIIQNFGMTNELAQQNGYDSAEVWAKAYLENLENYSVDDWYDHQIEKIKSKAKEFGINEADAEAYAEYIGKNARNLDQFDDALGGDIEKAGQAAISIMRMDKGLQQLSDDLKDATGAMVDNERGTAGYIKGLDTIQTDLSDILQVEKKYISEKFVVNHFDEIKKAAKGNEEAINSLRQEMAKDLAVEISTELKLDQTEAANFQSAVEDLSNLIPDLEIGVTLDDEKFNEIAQKILTTAGMTTEKANAIFGSLGFVTDFDVEYKPLHHSRPTTTTYHQRTVDEYDEFHNPINWKDVEWSESTYTDVTEDVPVPKILTKPNGEKTALSKTGSTTITGTYNGGASAVTKPTVKGSKKSGGSSSSKKDKTKKESDEIERYHVVDKQLENIRRNLEKIDKEKDRAFGLKHLAAIDKEIELLEKEKELLDQRFEEAKQNFLEDAGRLNAYGAIYGEDGTVLNYKEILSKAIADFNAGRITEDEYNYIKKIIKNYEDSYKEMVETAEESAEQAREILDSKLEAVEYQIDVKINLADFNDKYLDWVMKRLEDKAFSSIEKTNNLILRMASNEDRWDANFNGLKEYLKTLGATDEEIEAFLGGDANALSRLDLEQDQLDKIQSLIEGLMDAHDTLAETKKLIEEELINSWQEFNDEIDKTKAKYDHLEKRLSFFKDIIDMLGIDRLGVTGQTLAQLTEANINLAQQSLNSSQAQLRMNQNDLEKAKAARLNATSEEDQAMWDKTIEQISDTINNLQDEILDKAKVLLETIQSNFEDTVDQIFKEFEKRLVGVYDTFERLQGLFDQRKTQKDTFLPDYQATYELNKLMRSLNQEMSKMNSIRSQEKLRDLMQEINDLQKNNTQLTQYDLEYLQKRYDLRLAEIALEESQNNKNTVRLTRDSSGNYNYVYTADENNIDNARQKYEDVLYQTQKTTEDYLTNMSELFLKTQIEFENAIKEIAKDSTLTAEQKEQRINEAKAFYVPYLEYISGEINKGLSNNKSLYEDEAKSWAFTRQEMQDRGNEFTLYFNQTLLGSLLNDYNTINEYMDKFITELGSVDTQEGTLGKIGIELNNTEQLVNGVLEQITGTDMVNFNTALAEELKKTKDEVNDTAGKIESLEQRGSLAFNTLLETVKSVQEQMKDPMEKMTGYVTNLSGAYGILIAKIAGVESKYIELSGMADEATKGAGTTGSNISEWLKNQFNKLDTPEGKDAPKKGYNAPLGAETDTGGGIPSISGDLPTDDLKPTSTQQVDNDKTSITDKTYNTYEQLNMKQHKVIVHQSSGAIINSYDEDHTWQKKSYSVLRIDYTVCKCPLCGEHGVDMGRLGVVGLNSFGRVGKYLLENVDWSKMNPYGEATYDTGGYTGVWGPEGKAAILHEKELVLNKQDTKNILSTVDFVRQLSNNIDLQKLSVRQMAQGVDVRNALSSYSNASNNVAQEIHIDASFPGVTAREEIEQAFSDLATQALAYAHRY